MTRRPPAVAQAVAIGLALTFAHACAGVAADAPAPAPDARAAEAPPSPVGPRFFFAGSGRLQLRHAHFNTTLDVRYRNADGAYDPKAVAAIRRFFRSRHDGKEGALSLRLIELLGYVQTRFHPRTMTLLSGYRSPTFNSALRAAGTKAAQASLHTEGLAADLAFTGLDLRRLWLDLRELRSGGAGYYRSGGFLHIDTGTPRFWEETTSRVDENLSTGNARVFARTDFDRYADFAGAAVTLHGVTAFPLRVATSARLVGANGTRLVRLAADEGTTFAEDCITIPEYAAAYRLRVVGTDPPAASTHGHSDADRSRLLLATCAPQIERTPPEIETNAFDLLPPR